jgi:hypothetical protein
MSDGIDMMNTENIFVHSWSMSQFHEQRLRENLRRESTEMGNSGKR